MVTEAYDQNTALHDCNLTYQHTQQNSSMQANCLEILKNHPPFFHQGKQPISNPSLLCVLVEQYNPI